MKHVYMTEVGSLGLLWGGLCGLCMACSHPADATSSQTGAASGGSAAISPSPSGGSTALSSGTNPSSTLDGLGAYPTEDSTPTVGGTMTFTSVGSAGFWPRRLNRDAGDPACDIKDGLDTWGGHCCLSHHDSQSTTLSPFDEEMTLLLKVANFKQIAVYQPSSSATWSLVSSFDDRTHLANNLWFTQSGAGSTAFAGDLRDRDCVWYVAQTPAFECGDGKSYFCPNDPGILHRGWSGSKLIVLLANLEVKDANVKACNSDAAGAPAPWIAFVASELTRDGGRKWNGACNCYSKTGTVGDGCGEINLFEVVMDNNDWSNREFISTGVRSYQAGHVGGNVCGSGCARSDFPADQEVVDACAKSGYAKGPVLPMGGQAQGCPVWQRPNGDRYYLALLDETRRTIQVAIVHPQSVPSAIGALLPALPAQLPRAVIDALADLRLPSGG